METGIPLHWCLTDVGRLRGVSYQRFNGGLYRSPGQGTAERLPRGRHQDGPAWSGSVRGGPQQSLGPARGTDKNCVPNIGVHSVYPGESTACFIAVRPDFASRRRVWCSKLAIDPLFRAWAIQLPVLGLQGTSRARFGAGSSGGGEGRIADWGGKSVEVQRDGIFLVYLDTVGLVVRHEEPELGIYTH